MAQRHAGARILRVARPVGEVVVGVVVQLEQPGVDRRHDGDAADPLGCGGDAHLRLEARVALLVAEQLAARVAESYGMIHDTSLTRL